MVIEVGIFLFGHQCDDEKLGNYGRIIHAIGEKRTPYTVFLTGKTLEKIHYAHPLLKAAIEKYFLQNAGQSNPYGLEIGISTYNHYPLVPLGLELEGWGNYFQLVDEQIRLSKQRLWYDFGKNSRGIFPAECIVAPAAIHLLKQNWLDYCILDGAHLTGWEKGQVFQHQGLKLVVRNNEIPIVNPDQVRDQILQFAERHGVSRIVLGRDIDEFCYDGIGLLCQIGDALYAAGVEFKNVASIADNFTQPEEICHRYRQKGIQDLWHYTTSWIDSGGKLDWLRGESERKNHSVNRFIKQYFSVMGKAKERNRHDIIGRLDSIRHRFYTVSGMEFRHPDWTNQSWFNDFFYGEMVKLLGELSWLETTV